jgi:hypothetical protein
VVFMAKEESGISWTWLALGAVVVLGLVWFYGARNPAQFGEQPGRAVPTVAATLQPSQPAASPSPEAVEPAVSAATGGFVVPAVEEGIAEPACGDYTCDASERCDTCRSDCGCAGDEYCNRLNGVCYPLEA